MSLNTQLSTFNRIMPLIGSVKSVVDFVGRQFVSIRVTSFSSRRSFDEGGFFPERTQFKTAFKPQQINNLMRVIKN
jgi:hypothetical protein